MSWPAQRTTVHVHHMFGDRDQQGMWVATGTVGDYKSALSNGMEAFVRDLHPPAGRYMLFAPDQPYPPNGKGESIVFEVSYAEAIVVTNGRQSILGGDYPWSSYGLQEPSEWTHVDDRRINRSRADG